MIQKKNDVMGKILYILFLLLLLTGNSFAERVAVSQAQTIAGLFFQNHEQLKSASNLNLVYTQTFNFENNLKSAGNNDAFYVFTGNEKGFVIVSAENSIQPILAYSFENKFVPEDIPVQLAELLNDYSEQIRIAKEIGLPQLPEIKKLWDNLFLKSATIESQEVVEPFLKDENGNIIQWGQGDPFNTLCPILNGKRMLVGCVQTAEAQVMRFWRHPLKGTGENTYEWEGQILGVNFEFQTFDWQNMPAKNDGNWTLSQKFEIAKLCYDLGVANEANYNPAGTGSFTSPSPLINYFGYDKSAITIYRNNFPDTFWIQIIKQELNEGRPVVYSGGSDKNAGHAFVCDGYDSNNLFHINWGWEGKSDGYYTVSQMIPTSYYDFSYDNQAIIHLFPSGSNSGPDLSVNIQDSLALVAIYNETNGNNWKNNTNWLLTNVKDWQGIKVVTGRVYEVNLPDNNLVGNLPEELSNLTSLCKLNLGKNQLSGNTPTKLNDLKFLKELRLNSNKLTGQILPNIVDLQYLEELDLSGNYFSGVIPSQIGNLNNLTELSLYSNNFTGVIPDSLKNLQKLDRLWLHNNFLTGEIPSESLAEMGNLTEINLRNNQLEGSIPQSISTLKRLWNLDLSFNQLSGELNGDLFENSSITYLNLSNNQFTGEIPKELGYLVSEKSWIPLRINLSNNQFEGEIPVELSQLKNIDVLNLSGNQLTGTIPDQIFNIQFANPQYTHSSTLNLSNNQFAGDLPELLPGLEKLQYLYLNNNSFTGAIPQSINILKELRKIDLSSNYFSILPKIDSLKSLDSIDVSNNNLMFDSFLDNPDLINNEDIEFIYAPQNKFGEIIFVPANIGDTKSFTAECNGKINIYQWFLDGEVFSIKTVSKKLTIEHIDGSHFGNYTAKVTNNSVPGLTLESQPVKLFLNEGITKDSVALVALFYSTKGEEWTNKQNWLIGNISTWYGITLGENGRVESIDLNNKYGNNLIGDLPKEIGLLDSVKIFKIAHNRITNIPEEFNNLTAISVLDLSDNQLSEIPVIDNLKNIDSLFIGNNDLRFSQFEKSLDVFRNPASFLNLSPQTNFGTSDTTEIIEDSELIINYDKWGEYEHFTWKKDSVVSVYNRNLSSLRIPHVALSDAGIYTLEVTNDSIPGLTIYSLPKTFIVIHNIKKDSIALVDLYNSTNGNQWINQANWLEGPVSTWYGITTDPIKGVTNINLQDNNLNGSINPSIGTLINLEELILSGNQLSGTIPPEIGQLNKLKLLHLNQCYFSGMLPVELTLLVQLEELLLNNNKFHGNLPMGIGNLSQLKILNAYSNQFSGNIPPDIGGCSNLDSLDLGSNEFTDSIPNSIGECKNIRWINLAKNQLSGSLPNSIGNLTNLEKFYIESNQLSGTLPGSIGNLSNLEILLAQNNQLTGDIPPEIGGLTNLRTLFLNNNNLNGQISQEIGSLQHLEILLLDSNQIAGTIPETIGYLTKLELIDISHNNLTGSIPATMGNLVQLKKLNLSFNHLNGNIPDDLGQLSSLQTLKLNSNNINGCLPSGLGNLSAISFIDMSLNQISGEIPPSIGNLSNLETLYLNSNNLQGKIPVEIGNLSFLEILDLNSNYLSESIPDEIGNLSSLKILNLSLNNLDGSIPNELGNLLNLEALYLQNNKLSGKVPEELTNCCFQYFYIDNNELNELPDFDLHNFKGNHQIGLSNNMFTFEDFEKNANVINTASYANISPQAKFDSTKEFYSLINTNVKIIRVCGGDYNHYRWFRNENWLQDAEDSDTLNFYCSSRNDFGEYFVTVSNDLFPGVTLSSNPVILVESYATMADIQEGLNAISFYPNPTKNFIYLNNLPTTQNIQITIYNPNGRIVSNTQTSNQKNIQLPFYNYPNGFYFIRLESDNNQKTLKIIKN